MLGAERIAGSDQLELCTFLDCCRSPALSTPLSPSRLPHAEVIAVRLDNKICIISHPDDHQPSTLTMYNAQDGDQISSTKAPDLKGQDHLILPGPSPSLVWLRDGHVHSYSLGTPAGPVAKLKRSSGLQTSTIMDIGISTRQVILARNSDGSSSVISIRLGVPTVSWEFSDAVSMVMHLTVPSSRDHIFFADTDAADISLAVFQLH